MNGITETHIRILSDYGFVRGHCRIGHIEIWHRYSYGGGYLLSIWIDSKYGRVDAHSDCSAIDHGGYYKSMPEDGDFESFIAEAVAAH